MSSLIIISIFILTITLILFIFYKKIALSKNFLDKPQIFSSHKSAVPTGAGIILIILILSFYFFLKSNLLINLEKLYFPNRDYLLIFSVFILGLINFYDDIKQTHPLYRLCAHFACVMLSLSLFSFINHDLYAIIPEKVFLIFLIFFWVYLINIFNFLDGSDGYLSINSITCFLAFFLTSLHKEIFDFDFYLSLLLILILVIYLFFNFPKAKIFMGDSGSITIGYLIGYFSFVLLFNGNWNIAFAIIFYPLLDVSLTIIRKVKNGYYPWERLFDYFFLRALKGQNFNHKKIFFISLSYNLLNLLNIILMINLNLKWLIIFTMVLGFLKIFLFNKLSRVNI